MIHTISITKEESKHAKSNGEIYGVIKKLRMNINVYVELGTERQYLRKGNDDTNTKYKFFTGCEVIYFKNREDLMNWSNGEEITPIQTLINQNVKICF